MTRRFDTTPADPSRRTFLKVAAGTGMGLTLASVEAVAARGETSVIALRGSALGVHS